MKTTEIEELFTYNGKNSVEDWKSRDNRKRKWPWALLEVGESFLAKIPHDQKQRNSLKAASIIWRMNNDAMHRKFEFTNVPDGYLVKRTC